MGTCLLPKLSPKRVVLQKRHHIFTTSAPKRGETLAVARETPMCTSAQIQSLCQRTPIQIEDGAQPQIDIQIALTTELSQFTRRHQNYSQYKSGVHKTPHRDTSTSPKTKIAL
ncbi:hypothetical protein KSS87_014772 [Heliosperma pusillum]|nr:hypothetical protein KSS87_014772 [Heliosperma pusillum]